MPSAIINVCSNRPEKASNTIIFPDTKLQSLDTRIGDLQLYCPMEIFEQSLAQWDGIPIIYNRQGIHPDNFTKVTKNPKEAAAETGGKLVGRVSNPRIERVGDPRLMASLVIDSDEEEIVQLYNDGRLFPSTAFSVEADDDGTMQTPPVPNHVLLFERQLDGAQPGDPGVYIHTHHDGVNTPDSAAPQVEMGEISKFYLWLKNLFSRFSKETKETKTIPAIPDTPKVDGANTTNTQEDHPMDDHNTPASGAELHADETPELSEFEKIIKEKQVEIDELKAEIAGLKAQIEDQKAAVEAVDELKEKLKAYEQAEADSKFTTFLDSIPAGQKATEEQRAKLRESWDADPVSIMLSILSTNSNKGGETSPTGQPYKNTSNVSACTSVGDMCSGGK